MKVSLGLTLILALGVTSSSWADNPESTRSTVLESIVKDCYSSDLHEAFPTDLKINGHSLLPDEAKNLYWISQCVVPFLPGTKEENAAIAAKAAWWSLREGVLQIAANKVFRNAACHGRDGHDHVWSNKPTKDCPTNIWQVGITAGQVVAAQKALIHKAYIDKTELVLSSLHASLTEKDLLGWTAELGGYPAGSPTYRAILNSTGRVKYSWLQRNPLIGTVFVGENEVDGECYRDKKKWCFSGNYPQAKYFAHNSAAMKQSISDIQSYFLKN